MRVLVRALCIVVVLLIPSWIGVETKPPISELSQKYAKADYVLIEGKVYKLGPATRTTSKVINYFSRETDLIDRQYVFVRCAGEKNLFLSPSNPRHLEILEHARFVGPKDTAHPRFAEYYKDQCWSSLALADRWHRFMSRIKFWEN